MRFVAVSAVVVAFLLALAASPVEGQVLYSTCSGEHGETQACVCIGDVHRACGSPYRWGGEPCEGGFVVLYGPPTGEQGVCMN